MSEPRLSIIPGWIITDPRLKGKDLQVLCMLGRNANTRHGWCRRSQVKLAAALGCARSTVQAAIDRLVEIGAVERREVVSSSGRDSAHWYRVIYDSEVPSDAFSAWDEEDGEEFGPIDPVETEAPPAGIPAPPAGPGSAPPAGPEPAPINASTLTPPAEREERERAREISEDDPKVMRKRFKALELGLHNNPWPGALGSDSDWAFREFQKLSPEERRLAEERRDAYLAVCPKVQSGENKGQPKPVALGVYFKNRKFLDVAAIAPRAVLRARAGELVHVAPFGPIWAGLRMLPLLEGPVNLDIPDDLRQTTLGAFEAIRRTSENRALSYLERKGIAFDGKDLIFPDDFEEAEYRRRVTDAGYPEVNRLHKLAGDRMSEKAPAWCAVFGELCEAVPVGGEMFETWRTYHLDHGFPFVPDPGSMRVVYFPKGGPEGLAKFEQAARAAMSMERGDDDAA